jgi:hypothetical protein
MIFHGKMAQICQILKKIESKSPNFYGKMTKLLWLNYFVDNHHFEYIIKSLKETLLFSFFFFFFFILKIWQNLTPKNRKNFEFALK